MKKYIITVIFAIGFGMSLNAQRDGFFTSNYSEFRETPDELDMGDMPGLFGHGYQLDQTAPLGSGLLVLSAMGLAYAIRRKKDNE